MVALTMMVELRLVAEAGAANAAAVDGDGEHLLLQLARILALLAPDLDHLEEALLCRTLLALGLAGPGEVVDVLLVVEHLS